MTADEATALAQHSQQLVAERHAERAAHIKAAVLRQHALPRLRILKGSLRRALGLVVIDRHHVTSLGPGEVACLQEDVVLPAWADGLGAEQNRHFVGAYSRASEPQKDEKKYVLVHAIVVLLKLICGTKALLSGTKALVIGYKSLGYRVQKPWFRSFCLQAKDLLAVSKRLFGFKRKTLRLQAKTSFS